MEVGTEILLARMKEHPEEFTSTNWDSRWGIIMTDAEAYLPEEDKAALKEGMRQLYIDRFNERVLKRLAGEEEPQEEPLIYKDKPTKRYQTGWSDPRAMLGQQQAVQITNSTAQNAIQGALGSGLGLNAYLGSLAGTSDNTNGQF